MAAPNLNIVESAKVVDPYEVAQIQLDLIFEFSNSTLWKFRNF